MNELTSKLYELWILKEFLLMTVGIAPRKDIPDVISNIVHATEKFNSEFLAIGLRFDQMPNFIDIVGLLMEAQSGYIC